MLANVRGLVGGGVLAVAFDWPWHWDHGAAGTFLGLIGLALTGWAALAATSARTAALSAEKQAKALVSSHQLVAALQEMGGIASTLIVAIDVGSEPHVWASSRHWHSVYGKVRGLLSGSDHLKVEEVDQLLAACEEVAKTTAILNPGNARRPKALRGALDELQAAIGEACILIEFGAKT